MTKGLKERTAVPPVHEREETGADEQGTNFAVSHAFLGQTASKIFFVCFTFFMVS
jgi:hypothetical protein